MTRTLIKAEIIDSGAYKGINLVDIKRLMSWHRRGYVQWVKGKAPLVQLNAYKFEIVLRRSA